ncbi:xylulokinase [Pseudonocardia kunmingensis]|uniref:Xylulokinase n=1 Tax=Pseudonocardia kunmingensis TaxID=630975 RepID=A0A543DNG3_9PSEU|nr:FGGY-family carbohydrate kinase [Pseudonocardia kunmingensis]TQM10848.1 xylulokinase [Pseudonocardia kunmingensis]
MSVWLGVDVGTSSVKALAVGDDGAVLARGHAEHPTRRAGDHVEQDPDDWVRGLAAVVAQCADAGDPDGVAVVGHTPSLVLAGADRRAVLPCLTWQDVRAGDEARDLQRDVGDARAAVGTDLPWGPSYLPAKLLWAARHAPAALTAARWLLQPKDHVGHVLTGVAATDPWSSKGLCRVDAGAEPVLPVLAAAGTGPALLPPRRDPWSLLGRVDGTGAAASGLPAGVPVAVGWSDALAGMAGIGAFEEPSAFLLTGTSQIAGLTGAEPAGPTPLLTVPATCAPLPICYGPTQAGGAALAWAAALLGREPDALVALAMTADPAAVPRFLPYLDGERAPLWRPDVRGVLQDLGSAAGPAEVGRAVMRGIVLSTRHVLATAAEATGVPPGPVHLGGRSASQPEWTRVQRETLGRPLVAHREAETAALGAAVLAAAAVTGDPLGTCSRRMGGRSGVQHPDAAEIATGDVLYREYLRDVEAELARRGGAA